MAENIPLYQDYMAIADSLRGYASPKAKLTSMIKAGKIIKIRRGLYISPGDPEASGKTLANKIYGPSYISFEYVLSYYGLIPERAHTVTSASMGKNKNRLFHTPVGDFLYQSIPPAVFPYGVLRMEEAAGPFLIAAKEKALCDTLSKIGGITTIPSLEAWLYDDMRLEREDVFSLSVRDIGALAPLYGKKSIKVLLEYLKKKNKS
ncbi:MAG: hypothetical protein V1913_00400 [Fibrobacterota bacterium]